MDFNLTQEQRMIYEYGDRISKQFDHNYWRGYAEKNERPTELYQQITDDGFLGIMVPEAYGGAGQGMTEMLLFIDRKSTRLNSSHIQKSRMPSSA